MHSITESDGVPSDPYEVLCHMAALIIEGRTPLHVSKGIGDCTVSGDPVGKAPKPYHEGPHCPNFKKMFNKESLDIHKCSENNVACIRFSKLKQHLMHLFGKSLPISIEVSLGPDCLCGELRSQSTLVSGAPCKRDVILEQWTISISNKRGHEPSQMSVMNLYQAVRSLLHFSQLTAWYMRNNGKNPANVIYRVGVPGDSTFLALDHFAKHDFPLADINKGFSIKMSVKSAPRMESIPSVYCPQHLCGHLDVAQSMHHEDFTRLNKDKKCLGHGIGSKLGMDEKDELTDLPLKFQGVRKKIYKPQERKGKRMMGYTVKSDLSNCIEYLDNKSINLLYDCYGSGKPSYLKSQMFAIESDLEETQPCQYIKQENLSPYDPYSLNMYEPAFMGSNLKNEADRGGNNQISEICSTKRPDILDDRMQITCGISGKHHCKCEYDEDVESSPNLEKPRRRRSLGKSRPDDCSGMNMEPDRILHGKFKDVDSGFKGRSPVQKPCTVTLKTVKRSIQNETSKWISSDLPIKKSLTESPDGKATSSTAAYTESLPAKEMDLPSDLDTTLSDEERHKRFLNKENEMDADSKKLVGSLIKEENQKEYYTAEEDEDGEEEWESSENPFMAAILRTTKRWKHPKEYDGASKGTLEDCDNSQNNNLCHSEIDKNEEINNINNNNNNNNINNVNNINSINNNCDFSLDDKIDNGKFLQQKAGGEEEISDRKTKAAVPEESSTTKEFEVPMETCHVMHPSTPAIRCRNRMNLDLKSEHRLSAVKNLSSLGCEDSSDGNTRPSEFISRSLSRLKSMFYKRDFARESTRKSEESCRIDFDSENSVSSVKTIPVPSAQEKLKFRRSLDSAAQLVFHRCSGLPLTSSPAPVRRNNSSFSFDSSLNSVSAIKSALFDSANSISSEDENESEGSLRSPASPGAWSIGSKSINYHSLSPLPLLGTFEESVLNGRLEPVSTVQGFTAELGASGSFCPRHLYLPVTVFFYTLGDNDKVSAPYLGHINLGKKGYNVPRSGTIQVTLFNPLRTVVKMFVVVYDLHDMPPNSHTFLRQRTLYVPASQKESVFFGEKDGPFENEDYHKYLRYLIHLRFISGKTGRIYLHTDIRMIIFRKSDEDTATALGRQVDGETFELRSHTHGPTNPKFSPRK